MEDVSQVELTKVPLTLLNIRPHTVGIEFADTKENDASCMTCVSTRDTIEHLAILGSKLGCVGIIFLYK